MSSNTLAAEAVTRMLEVNIAKESGSQPPPPSRDDVLAGLTKYIPTESITLYVAAVSSQNALTDIASWLTPGFTYAASIAFTPMIILALFLRKLANANQNWMVSPTLWPWWRMIASTIAFSVWAIAIPGNPIISGANPSGGVVAGFAAVLVSTFLNLFAPLFEQKHSSNSSS